MTYTHDSEQANAKLPAIDARNEDLAVATCQAWKALQEANRRRPQLFRHGEIVRIELGDQGVPVLREMTVDRMRHALARCARYFRLSSSTRLPVAPPLPVVRDLLASPNPPLPVLTRIVEAPVFAPDGTLQTGPGYHAASRTFYYPAPDFQLPAVPEKPTEDELMRARSLILDELLCDFPFMSFTERTHAVALLLLPYVRNLIDGPTPLHLIEKPSPGTGATLLVDSLTYPATGRPAAAMAEGRDEDEWRKRITAKIADGSQIVLIDNLRHRLDSAALSAAITSRFWEDRRLGHSEMILLSVECIWIATGNNPALSLELARRTVRIRLDARSDRPWLREGFRHADLRRWIAGHRAELVWAALVVIRRWLAEGRPESPNPTRLGMFESWSRILGGILHTAAFAGFLGNLDDFYSQSDSEGEVWRSFISSWSERFGERPVTAGELYDLAELLDLGSGSERSQRTRLGKLLGSARDRQFGGLRIEKGGVAHGLQRWRLARILADGGTSRT